MYDQFIILGKVAFAALLGGVIGAEREYTRKTAGMRTLMLVAAASALLQSLAVMITSELAASAEPVRSVQADPTRVIQAIITGISFLGAGAIVLRREVGVVRGLTTAATVLLVAAIGITVGLGEYVVAAGVTVGALLVLIVVKPVEKSFASNRRTRKPQGPGDAEAG